MNNINNKLEKYRFKLINATDPEKIELYNVKMQYYLLMQKKLLKSGGGSSANNIFSIVDNPEKNKESFENWLKNNPEKYKEIQKNSKKRYYEKNPEI